ncbi:hypothetical protein Y1Q_0003880 [Alligator mississippiensis]|uniref:Uncharacterized protein n=1 Tax=Alligator mississippiensis TaxID=8496 RepID=A0A151MNM3_ALLMI|nr:hypothetical protein Y1Q_0003880 [Alligator mississippiensis]
MTHCFWFSHTQTDKIPGYWEQNMLLALQGQWMLNSHPHHWGGPDPSPTGKEVGNGVPLKRCSKWNAAISHGLCKDQRFIKPVLKSSELIFNVGRILMHTLKKYKC